MPLLWLSLVFMAGIGSGQQFHWPVSWWGALALVSLILSILQPVLKKRIDNFPSLTLRLPNPDGFPASFLSLFLLFFSFTTGGLRYQLGQPIQGEQFITAYRDQGAVYQLQGVVVRPPDERDRYTQLTIRAEQIQSLGEAASRPVTGLVLARLAGRGDWRYGDRVTVQGELNTPPEDEEFSYRDYLARQGIYAFMPGARASLIAPDQGSWLLAWVYAFRYRSLRSLYAIFPDPEAALLAGILLGIDQGIPESVTQAFQDSGTSHIIAISGFNISIVAGVFAVMFGRLLGKRRGALAALVAIALYTLVVGAGPTVMRAALMAGLAVFAAQVGRRGNGLNTLAMVAALMALANPNILWDVGFQLSFMATLGLVLYAGPLMEGFARLAGRFLPEERARRLARPAGEYFLFTLAALFLVLPVSIYYFRRLPLAALLANPLVLPVQPALMILGGLAMLVGMVSQPLGQIVAYLAWPLAAYTIRMAEFWAGFKEAVLIFGQMSGWVVGLFYLTVFYLTFAKPWQRLRARAGQAAEPGETVTLESRWAAVVGWLKRSSGSLLGAALGGLALLAVLVWQAVAASPDGRLHLTVLDVGSGEALLVQTTTGRSVLIDGGGSPTALSNALGRRLPLGQRRLDLLIVAGAENDQVEALPRVLPRYPPGKVLWSGPGGGTRGARALEEYLAAAEISVTLAETGQEVDLGDGAVLKVVSANRRGMTLQISDGSFQALLPVSLDPDALEAMLADPTLDGMNVLLLSDGGYAPANPPALLARLNPQVILLSVAAGNRRNLPDAETLQAVQGYPLLRTDQNGWIEISTDGKQMWVEVERR